MARLCPCKHFLSKGLKPLRHVLYNGRQVVCQTEFKTQIAYRARGPVTYGKITALVRATSPSPRPVACIHAPALLAQRRSRASIQLYFRKEEDPAHC